MESDRLKLEFQVIIRTLLATRVGALRAKRTDVEYELFLRDKINPLISLLIRKSVLLAQQKKYKDDVQQAEQETLYAIKTTFKTLKQSLNGDPLRDNQVIKRRICIIESMLSFRPEDDKATKETGIDGTIRFICNHCGDYKESHRVYVFPSYVEGLYNEVSAFCGELFDLGREDIVKNFVEVSSCDQENLKVFRRYYCFSCKYIYDSETALIDDTGALIFFDTLDDAWQCPNCGNDRSKFLPLWQESQYHTVQNIERFIFAPSIFKMIELQNIFQDCTDVDAEHAKKGANFVWAAWEIIDIFRGVESEPARDALRKNNILSYNSLKANSKSRQLLVLNDLKQQCRAITNATQGNRINLYKRHSLNKALNVVLDHIFDKDFDTKQQHCYPKSLELKISDHTYFELYVEWESGLIEVLLFQRFRDGFIDNETGNDVENEIFNFVKKLLNNVGIFCILKDLFGNELNAKKHLGKIGLKDILYDLFIITESGSSVALKNKKIVLNNISKSKLNQLHKIINSMKTKVWIIDEKIKELDDLTNIHISNDKDLLLRR